MRSSICIVGFCDALSLSLVSLRLQSLSDELLQELAAGPLVAFPSVGSALSVYTLDRAHRFVCWGVHLRFLIVSALPFILRNC